jgi:hypothetical protein
MRLVNKCNSLNLWSSFFFRSWQSCDCPRHSMTFKGPQLLFMRSQELVESSNCHLYQIRFNIIPGPNQHLLSHLCSMNQNSVCSFHLTHHATWPSHSQFFLFSSYFVMRRSCKCCKRCKSCKSCNSVLYEEGVSCYVEGISDRLSLGSWSDVCRFQTDCQFWTSLTGQKVTS